MTTDQHLLVTNRVMQALDEWKLGSKGILAVLDFPDDVRGRKLDQYRKNCPFPDISEVNERVIRILGIIDALRTTFPRSTEMRARWMNAPNSRLDNRSPVKTMIDDGLDGVTAVLVQLDCSYAWDLSGSHH